MEPRPEYTQRLETRRAAVARLEALHIRLGNFRLGIAFAAAALAWLTLVERAAPAWWLLAPVALFMALAVYHDAVLRRREYAQRAMSFYERGIQRLDGNWAGRGEAGERFLAEPHPYAEDLDIFGRGSLFELLCQARTRSGEHALAEWLKAPADIDEIRRRQEAIDELKNGLDFREDLALLGETVRTGVHAEPLAHWSEAPPVLDYPKARILAAAISLCSLTALAWWGIAGNRVPFLFVAVFLTSFGFVFRQRVAHVIASVDEPAHDLALLAAVLARIERETFQSPLLREMRQKLDAAGAPPSVQIARLNRIMELIDSRDNVAVRVFGPLVLWTTQLAFAAEAWRMRTGHAVRDWLVAAGHVEALSSLAAYAFEHPVDRYPEFIPGAALCEARGIAHPLLPEARAVRNDVRLAADAPLLVVSGSNMSGKSTLLRTIGVNAVLAMTGAPVRADSLRLSPLRIGASIRVMDSLQQGSSRFYAEIRRLRELVEIASGDRPLLFLLDELLHGTNSHDRLTGGAAVVRGLVARGAIGLITTHDLALAQIAESVQPAGDNVHFEDHLENGAVTFDYRLRQGVVKKSNALELMRSIGLDV